MESIWTTAATILATGIVIYGGYFLRDFLQGKRETERQKLEREHETREARRKDRERVVIPIREALVKLQAGLRGRLFLKFILESIPVEKREHVNLSGIEALQPLKELTKRSEITDKLNMFVEVEPLISTITKQDTREFLQKVFLIYGGLTKEQREEEGILDNEEEDINLAYQKLEDFVALAD